jgi:hypothetical protein
VKVVKNIPWISLTIGILMSLALYKFSPLTPNGTTVLPMLAALFMSELGALMTVYSVFLGVREMQKSGIKFQVLAMALGNLLLLLNFAYVGLELWAKSQLAG